MTDLTEEKNKVNPRQELCWALYINPDSDTFGNAYASAIKAGYEETTSLIITTSPWFQKKLERLNRANRALKNLDEVINLEIKEMDDKDGLLRSDLLKHRSEISNKILEVTNDEWNPKRKIDITSQGDKVVGITYIIPDKKDDTNN
jgi:hypothetical protein